MSNEDFRYTMKKQLPKTTRNMLAEAIKNEVKKILREMSETTSSLSPEAEKALEQSKVAKQNKDAQKKRAAAKQSMRGMSVEGADPTVEEQFSRMPGDKLQSDEGDFFDTDELHLERDHDDKWNDQFDFDFAPADEIGLYDEKPGVTSEPEDFMDPYPEDESVKIREQKDIYDPYSPGPREYSDEPESIEYDEQEAWEWDREMVDDEWADYGEEY
jgi:hypothetical protein